MWKVSMQCERLDDRLRRCAPTMRCVSARVTAACASLTSGTGKLCHPDRTAVPCMCQTAPMVLIRSLQREMRRRLRRRRRRRGRGGAPSDHRRRTPCAGRAAPAMAWDCPQSGPSPVLATPQSHQGVRGPSPGGVFRRSFLNRLPCSGSPLRADIVWDVRPGRAKVGRGVSGVPARCRSRRRCHG